MPDFHGGFEILLKDPSDNWGNVQDAIGVKLPLKDAVVICEETGEQKSFTNAGRYANFVRRNKQLGLVLCMKD